MRRSPLPRLSLVTAALLTLAGCGAGTPPGTTVLDHHYGPEVLGYEGVSLGEAVGEAQTATSIVDFDPGEGPALRGSWKPVRLRVEVDHGPVRLEGERADYELPETWDIPRDIRVVVEDSGKFSVEISCDEELMFYDPDGIFAEIRSGDPAAEAINSKPGASRHCSLDLKRSSGNTIFRLVAFGDGVVLGDPVFGAALEITPQ